VVREGSTLLVRSSAIDGVGVLLCGAFHHSGEISLAWARVLFCVPRPALVARFPPVPLLLATPRVAVVGQPGQGSRTDADHEDRRRGSGAGLLHQLHRRRPGLGGVAGVGAGRGPCGPAMPPQPGVHWPRRRAGGAGPRARAGAGAASLSRCERAAAPRLVGRVCVGQRLEACSTYRAERRSWATACTKSGRSSDATSQSGSRVASALS
jgi:hypothetical protein